ncbi:12654_t:CDS:2 [Ambispora leptoticha]|uniref:12654_t:CDS:1 n=1 Tax=Ambispora leptoticha TaxID=144679 RepID=A0A9N8V3W0_9GLOM|nr:12654_t:CDS:2 [Ambispora leptoticha]
MKKVTTLASITWKDAISPQKQPFADIAEKIKEKHKSEHPEYAYRPMKKNNDFKIYTPGARKTDFNNTGLAFIIDEEDHYVNNFPTISPSTIDTTPITIADTSYSNDQYFPIDATIQYLFNSYGIFDTANLCNNSNDLSSKQADSQPILDGSTFNNLAMPVAEQYPFMHDNNEYLHF